MNATSIRILLPMLTAFAFLHSVSCIAQTGDDRWLHHSLADAVDRITSQHALVIDPALRRRIVAEGDTMNRLFCFGPESMARCRRELSAPRIQAEVGRYLQQLRQSNPEVRRISDGLANLVGNNLAQAGEPPNSPNDVGIVLLPNEATRGTIYLSTASGKTNIGRSASVLLMLPGTYRISIVDGDSERIGIANVSQRSSTTLTLSRSGSEAPSFGRLDPPDESFCFHSGDIRFSGPVAMYNWGRATIREPAATKQSALAQTAIVPAVSIALDDRAGICGSDCTHSIGVVFAEAIATWKAGCERCDQNAMSVVTVAGTTWVDTRIAHRLRASSATISLDLNHPVQGEFARRTAPAVVPTRTAIYGYEQISGNSALIRAACALDPSADAPWMDALRASMCGGSWAGVRRIQPVLRLLSGPTQCGEAKDFLACGLPDRGIEISVQLDRFELSGTQPPFAIGNGGVSPPIDLRAVILHEVGHWFGIPHFETTGLSALDIMAETYGDGRACVSGVSLMMLNNATDMRWSYRVNEGKGLRRPGQNRVMSPSR